MFQSKGQPLQGHLTGVFLVLQVVPYPSKYFLILMIHSKVIIVNTYSPEGYKTHKNWNNSFSVNIIISLFCPDVVTYLFLYKLDT